MVRPTWRGAISFGLVNVPVQLITAVRSHTVRFRQLHGKTNNPIRQQRVDAETGDVVPFEDIVKGYEVGDERYVVVDPAELSELDPKASRLIDIEDYVDQSEIDPVYYDRAYYLVPDGETAGKPYRLLTEAMERAGRVAIARFVMREKEYLAAIRAKDGMLVLSTMHHHDEVADPADLDTDAFTTDAEVRDREVTMAEQLIASMTTEFDATAYEDRHRARVLEYLEAKADGEQVDLGGEAEDTGEVIDLMEALERSLERARDGGGDTEVAGDDYESMSRDELYDIAQQRELPGRSSMSKAQLVEALRASDADSGVA
jgi:DNA end-binding protein Ku